MVKIPDTSVPCGNEYCDNQNAIVDERCGNLIPTFKQNCDHINYSVSKKIYSLVLEFVYSSTPDEIKAKIIEEGEVIFDFANLNSTNQLSEYLFGYRPDYGELICGFVNSLLVSFCNTFGSQSRLNPDSQVQVGPRWGSFYMALDGDALEINIQLDMHSKSHQHDFLDWGPKAIAEGLLNEEGLNWIHEGAEISLINVKIDDW
jgi:hypothetical protein